MPNTVILRTAALDSAIAGAGLDGVSAAAAMSLSPSALAVVRAGVRPPDAEFIAGALVAFPELGFGDLFEITREADDELGDEADD